MGELRAEYILASGQRLEIRQGDLTDEDTEAIVNAANQYLAHGGGVAGAIRRRGGESIQAESDSWVAEHGEVPVGQVAVTGAGSLRCRRIIHAVGPVWEGGGHDEAALLRSAAWNSLAAADREGLASLAMPAISSGIFGFPKERCAAILAEAALAFCAAHPASPLRLIRLTNIDEPTVAAMAAALAAAAGGAD